ncbi:DUF4352 domain-containing protein [Streptomyces sp. NPDC090085]|uniref:DUF4352 domain-containing protein n=1 Tax=Streptomyces sp. NPDC090085 TaxID=3365943 RepID=UPI00380BC783
MSQQFPPPGQQPPPGYGYPPPPPPPQPGKSSAGKIVGFSCLGIVGLFVLLAVVGSLLGGGTDGGSKKEPAAPQAAASPGAAQAPDPAPSSAKPEKKAAVAVTAKKTAFKKSIIAPDGGYTSVSVTVTNNSGKPIDVNPLYFAITDTNGTKHQSELGVDENQIATLELAPGENVTGVVSGKGEFTAKTVTYTDGLIGDSVRADVS